MLLAVSLSRSGSPISIRWLAACAIGCWSTPFAAQAAVVTLEKYSSIDGERCDCDSDIVISVDGRKRHTLPTLALTLESFLSQPPCGFRRERSARTPASNVHAPCL